MQYIKICFLTLIDVGNICMNIYFRKMKLSLSAWNPSINKKDLKLNTMQLVTPGGNHCCLMANDVQNSRLMHSFININHCI